jgi:hypothetical protein
MKKLIAAAIAVAIVSSAAITTSRAATIDDVERLHAQLQAANRGGGVHVELGGVNINAALLVLAEQILAMSKTPTVWATCFQFNLAINTELTPDAAATIRKTFDEAAAKITEACNAINQNQIQNRK